MDTVEFKNLICSIINALKEDKTEEEKIRKIERLLYPIVSSSNSYKSIIEFLEKGNQEDWVRIQSQLINDGCYSMSTMVTSLIENLRESIDRNKI